MDERTGAFGTRWTVSAWDDRGRATLRAVAQDLPGALSVTLNSLLALSGAGDAVESGRSTPLRAERGDLDALLLDLASLLNEELETGAVAGVAVDGLLRTDTGWVAWGRALHGEGARCVAPVVLQGMPEISRSGGETRITAVLVRGGELNA
jgi:hypothetical protein